MQRLIRQVKSGLLAACMLVIAFVLLGGFTFVLNRTFTPEVVLKSSDQNSDCYVKQTPLGIEIQGSLSCVQKKGGVQ